MKKRAAKKTKAGDKAATLILRAETLTAAAFAPFGDVIATKSGNVIPINSGWAERYDDLAKIDVAAKGGRPTINIFRARPRRLPLSVEVMERHPLSSQAFIPLKPASFLVIVAPAGPRPRPQDIRCFKTKPGQGINFAPGTWHHPLVVFEGRLEVLVIDRKGPGENCDEIDFGDRKILCRL